MQDSTTPTPVAALCERLALVGVDVDPDRCDTVALRETGRDILALSALLDAERRAVRANLAEYMRAFQAATAALADAWDRAEQVEPLAPHLLGHSYALPLSFDELAANVAAWDLDAVEGR